MRGCWSGWISLGLSFGLIGGGINLPTVPAAAQSPTPSAYSQEQIALFAQIVLAMEPHRVEAHTRSQQTDDSQAKDQIRREFIRTATEIITGHGMTVPDYNSIVLSLQGQDGDLLKQQIEAQIRQIQLSDPQAYPTPVN